MAEDTQRNPTRERLPGKGTTGRKRPVSKKRIDDSENSSAPETPVKPRMIQQTSDEIARTLSGERSGKVLPTQKVKAKPARNPAAITNVAAAMAEHERKPIPVKARAISTLSYEEAWAIANEELPRERNRGSYADAGVSPLTWSWDAKDGQPHSNRRMARMAVTTLLSALVPAGLVYAAAQIGVGALKIPALGPIEALIYPFMLIVVALSISGLKWGLARMLHMPEWKALCFAVVIDIFAFGAKILTMVDKAAGYEARHIVYYAIMVGVMVVNVIAYWAHNFMSARKREIVDRELRAKAQRIFESTRK